MAAEDEVATLFVTREVAETGNVFHVLTDLLNAYITLRMLGWEDVKRQASASFFFFTSRSACWHAACSITFNLGGGRCVVAKLVLCFSFVPDNTIQYPLALEMQCQLQCQRSWHAMPTTPLYWLRCNANHWQFCSLKSTLQYLLRSMQSHEQECSASYLQCQPRAHKMASDTSI